MKHIIDALKLNLISTIVHDRLYIPLGFLTDSQGKISDIEETIIAYQNPYNTYVVMKAYIDIETDKKIYHKIHKNLTLDDTIKTIKSYL